MAFTEEPGYLWSNLSFWVSSLLDYYEKNGLLNDALDLVAISEGSLC